MSAVEHTLDVYLSSTSATMTYQQIYNYILICKYTFACLPYQAIFWLKEAALVDTRPGATRRRSANRTGLTQTGGMAITCGGLGERHLQAHDRKQRTMANRPMMAGYPASPAQLAPALSPLVCGADG